MKFSCLIYRTPYILITFTKDDSWRRLYIGYIRLFPIEI